jgi:monoamine oxidase
MAMSNSPYDIIIIGCGSAGIAAALELQKYQPTPHFLIIEARNRVGGRTYTDTNTFVADEPIDLGARWIHHYRPENPLSVHHIPSEKDQFDYDFFEKTITAFFDIDGTPLSDNLLAEAKQIVEELCTNIKQYSSDKEDISMFDVIHDKYNKIQDEQMRRLVNMNLAYIEHYEASNLDQLSAKSYLKSDSDIKTCDLTLPIGLGTFIEQIVEQHHLPVQLNTIVTGIDIPIDKNDFIRIMTHDNRHYLSKYVLITIPLGCLKARSIQFTPSLPDWKQNAIDRMGIGLLNKIYLQFPLTFWDEKLESIFIASNRFRFFLCFPHDHMLVLYVAGNIARELEQQTDEEIIEQILQCLQTIYPQIPKPIKWLVTRWGCDPFAYGSYSNFKIGATYETSEELARECYDGRIYWAGEHANYGGTIGCVDSAFESGHREGKRVYDKLNQVSN